MEAVGQVAPELIKGLSGVAKEIAAPIGNVDKIQIVDFGGAGKIMNAMTKFVPSVAKQIVEGLEAVGMNPVELLSKIGIKKTNKINSISKVETHF